ncbi:hypothetical protein MRB53_025891 [Persea americana]|uniref:Uncharacterized protein n=1 Tax=Persea americana TaxID=3435 RepID=A0ACC2LH25_PERAE|nr:hypothetical protein MRB53_025891 [Persea americana]
MISCSRSSVAGIRGVLHAMLGEEAQLEDQSGSARSRWAIDARCKPKGKFAGHYSVPILITEPIGEDRQKKTVAEGIARRRQLQKKIAGDQL